MVHGFENGPGRRLAADYGVINTFSQQAVHRACRIADKKNPACGNLGGPAPAAKGMADNIFNLCFSGNNQLKFL